LKTLTKEEVIHPKSRIEGPGCARRKRKMGVKAGRGPTKEVSPGKKLPWKARGHAQMRKGGVGGPTYGHEKSHGRIKKR